MSLTIEVFPASEGDSLLVSTESSNVLIDAGLSETYHTSIKPRLLELARDISFTPQKIAMLVNLELQKSVDLYVKKLNF